MKLYVINGRPQSGKTTFSELVKQIAKENNLSFINLSVVMPAKELAVLLGWDETKTDTNRFYLATLKDMMDNWDDTSIKYIKGQIEMCKYYEYDIVIIDCREPKDIDRIKELYPGTKTILLQRFKDTKLYGNAADDGVDDYVYDINIKNYGDLDLLKFTAKTFLEKEGLI